MFHHERKDEHLAAARAEVEALVQRLGRDVTNLDDGGKPIDHQALADASERYETASSQLSKAESIPEVLVARQIAIEGISYTRGVRTRQGLDPGPEPAPAPAPEEPAETHHAWSEGLHNGGLGTVVGAGAVGGVLGLIGGGLLGDMDGGWGGDMDDGGGWGGGF